MVRNYVRGMNVSELITTDSSLTYHSIWECQLSRNMNSSTLKGQPTFTTDKKQRMIVKELITGSTLTYQNIWECQLLEYIHSNTLEGQPTFERRLTFWYSYPEISSWGLANNVMQEMWALTSRITQSGHFDHLGRIKKESKLSFLRCPDRSGEERKKKLCFLGQVMYACMWGSFALSRASHRPRGAHGFRGPVVHFPVKSADLCRKLSDRMSESFTGWDKLCLRRGGCLL